MIVLTARFKLYINSFAQQIFIMCLPCVRHATPDKIFFHEAYLPEKYVNEQADFREWIL